MIIVKVYWTKEVDNRETGEDEIVERSWKERRETGGKRDKDEEMKRKWRILW